MKTRVFTLTVLTVLLVAQACKHQKEQAYDFPAAMLPEVKMAYKERCDKGLALYKMACARCHTGGSRRHPIIPDFSAEQLKGYALRVANRQHERNLPDSLVTEEELGIIMTFLTYKAKSGVAQR